MPNKMDIAVTLDTLRIKAEKIIEMCDGLKLDNQRLLQENRSFITTINEQKNELRKMEERLKVTAMARQITDGSEKNIDLKQKINEFVREIDKCITILNTKE